MAILTNVQTRLPLFITAGVTPGFVVGDNKYVNDGSADRPTLEGWDFTVMIPGVDGPLQPGVRYAYDDEETITLTGDYITGDGEVWVIQFQPKALSPAPVGPGAIKYSNGYDVNKVLNAILNRRRWRQPTRTDFPFVLSDTNKWTDDDTYSPVFESEHKIVTPYNVWIVQGDKDINEGDFNKYLQKLQTDIVLKCLNSVFSKRENLEKKLLFERFGRQDYINPNEGRFVGVRITPAKFFDVSVQIDSVALRFDSDVTFNLYLFHDTQPTVPLKDFEVSAVAGEQNIIPISEIISYSGATNKSGAYYLGYFQDDLGEAQAINEIVERFNPLFNFGVMPIELPAKPGHTVDVNQISFTIKTHGFNIQLSAFRDFTQLIVDNAYLFDNLIGLQMAADVIEMIQNTTRTNKDQRISGELTKMLYSDLNLAETTEESPFSVGLKARLKIEAKRVKNEFFPKQKPKSITHNTDNRNIYGTQSEVGGVYAY